MAFTRPANGRQRSTKHFAPSNVKQMNGTPGTCMTFTATICTSQEDRDHDVLHPEGANVDPKSALLFQHDANQPIGRLVTVTRQDKDSLDGEFVIADSELGRDCAKLVELGCLRISHGFQPTDFSERRGEDGKQAGWEIHAFDLLEVSLVSVPSNTAAVITAYQRNELKSANVITWVKSLGGTKDTGAQLRAQLAERLGRGEITTDQYVNALKADSRNQTSKQAVATATTVSVSSDYSAMDAAIDASVERTLAKGNFMSRADELIARAPSGDGNGNSDPRIRVKNVSEKYSMSRKSHDWNKYGLPARGFGGKAVEENSEWDNACFGVFMRRSARRAGIGAIEWTEHDQDVLNEMTFKQRWVGEIGGQYTEDIAPARVKTLLDDTSPGSGGDFINPYWFDDQLIVPALLTGEVFPFVDLVTIPRASSVHAGVMAIPTTSWDTSEGTAGTEYATGGMVNLLTTTIQACALWVEIGLDFLSDTPVNLGAFLSRILGERLAAGLDRVVAVGSPTNGEPLGMFSTPGYTVVADAYGSAGPATVGDVEGLIFALPKQYRTKANNPRFLMNDQMYRKYRAIPTATGWNTRAFDWCL